jgi:hypothetical protein
MHLRAIVLRHKLNGVASMPKKIGIGGSRFFQLCGTSFGLTFSGNSVKQGGNYDT